MARLARLAVADHAHLVLLRGHGGLPVFHDDADRSAFLAALQSACSLERVALHAYALLRDRVWLLCTPASAQGLGRATQALGRRFAASHNRRHQRSGSVWDGRYRCAVVETGALLLESMVFVDQAPSREAAMPGPLAAAWSSARHHAGISPEHVLTDPPEYWALGNTPFERCAAYRGLLDEPLAAQRIQTLTAAVLRGWPVGSPMFLERLRVQSSRPVSPRPRGRPRKSTISTKA